MFSARVENPPYPRSTDHGGHEQLISNVGRLKPGLYSETGSHIGMDRNFVCLLRSHNCRSEVIDLSLSVLIS
jgi:hypothetical protein